MSSPKTRLEQLETRAAARSDDWIVVYLEDGEYWRGDRDDYRTTIDPDAEKAQRLTAEEFHQLEAEHNVILVRYVDMAPGALN